MKCTCGHPDNYNYAIDNGLCNSCIEAELERLRKENEQLRGLLELWLEAASGTFDDEIEETQQALKGDKPCPSQ